MLTCLFTSDAHYVTHPSPHLFIHLRYSLRYSLTPEHILLTKESNYKNICHEAEFHYAEHHLRSQMMLDCHET